MQYLKLDKIAAQKDMMIILDNPLKVEMTKKVAFSAPSLAQGLLRPLSMAGVKRTDIHFSYLASFYPPSGDLATSIAGKRSTAYLDYQFIQGSGTLHVKNYLYTELLRLREEIKAVNPKVILVVGKWALLLLTQASTYTETARSKFGTLLTWRGSHLELTDWWENEQQIVCLPTLPTNAEWSLPEGRQFKTYDFTRLNTLSKLPRGEGLEPDWDIVVCEEFETAEEELTTLLGKLEIKPLYVSVDVETEFCKYIDCLAFGAEAGVAFVIPLAADTPHYWNKEQEVVLVGLMIEILLHKNCLIIGQNFSYDMQFFYALWGISISPAHDTMITNHCLNPAGKKDLATLSSMYCNYHRYWKNEGKLNKGATRFERWEYNGKDVIVTYEIAMMQKEVFVQGNLNTSPVKFQHEMVRIAAKLGNRGVRVAELKRAILTKEVEALLSSIKGWFSSVGLEYNLNSAPQLQELFYGVLNAPMQVDRTRGTPSTGDEARKAIIESDILYRPFCEQLDVYKKYGSFLRTFLKSKLRNGRVHTEYGVAATDTFRFNSKKNAFNEGMNLQNVSKGKMTLAGQKLPSLKEVIIPDVGYTLIEADLSGADTKIVAAESGSRIMKEIFDSGEDLYSVLASECFGREVKKSDPLRQQFKAVAHACLTGSHEVLTEAGWVRLRAYARRWKHTPIVIWDTKTERTRLEQPKGFYAGVTAVDEPLVRLEGKFSHQIVTTDHKIPWKRAKADTVVMTPAANLKLSGFVPINGVYDFSNKDSFKGNLPLLVLEFLRGDIREGRVHVSYHRMNELNFLRRFLGLHGQVYQKVGKSVYWDLAEEHKDFHKLATFQGGLREEEAVRFIELLPKIYLAKRGSDGIYFKKSHLKQAVWAQTLACLVGWRGVLSKFANGGRMLRLVQTSLVRFPIGKIELQEGCSSIFCPSTSTGAFLVRYKELIQVTGNTHYMGKPPTIAANTGLTVDEVAKTQDWYFGVNPELVEYHRKIRGWIDGRGWMVNVFGYIYRWLDRSRNTRYNQGAAWQSQCLSGRHKVLTENGLVPIAEVTLNHKVAVWCKDTQKVRWENPQRLVRSRGEVYKIDGSSLQLEATAEHKMAYKLRVSDTCYSVDELQYLPPQAIIPTVQFSDISKVQELSSLTIDSVRGKLADCEKSSLGVQDVYCLTVSTGFFITELNDVISVTGNSSIALLINKILFRIDALNLPWLQPLMQVHDSIVMQIETDKLDEGIKLVRECFNYPLPFPSGDVIIPVDIEGSDVSWADKKLIVL